MHAPANRQSTSSSTATATITAAITNAIREATGLWPPARTLRRFHSPPTSQQEQRGPSGISNHQALSEKYRTAAQLTHRKLRFLFIVDDHITLRKKCDPM